MKAAILLAAVWLVVPVSVTHAQTKAPNILFIAVDDLNDWTGALGGHPQAKTPNLDCLAKSGMLFTRAYCAAPACNPSRTAILTGLRPASTGVYHNNQPWRPALPDSVTLMQYLMSHGYFVLGGGKIFHYQDPQCWHQYFKGKEKAEAVAEQKIKKKGKKKAEPLAQGGIGGNMTWGPLDAADTDLPDGKLTNWAIEQVKKKHDRPFFLAVGYVKPHLAWHVPKKYFDMHPLDNIQLPKVLDNDLDDVPAAGVKMAKPDGDHKQIVATGQWKQAVQAYLACCTYMDAQLGRLLDALADSVNAGTTIIILWSDHGWTHGQKQHWRKFSLWDQDCRVVFTMNVPGLTKAGQRCERTVSLLDLYPTINELCGLPAKKGLEGNSLVPLLKNPQTTWDYPALTTHGLKNHSLRSERWRYIQYKNGSEELYDHTKDPLEWKNLAKDPAYADVKRDMASKLPGKNALDAEKKKESTLEALEFPSPMLQVEASDLSFRARKISASAKR
ncbi:MAG: sulfatase [Gemmataceae bacterium]|nr:sulfatase [Gemmataceae bacterium]